MPDIASEPMEVDEHKSHPSHVYGDFVGTATPSQESASSVGTEEDDAVPDILDLEGQSALMEKIRDQKKKGMFVSGWENDDDGVAEKNMNDPKEQVLTAAEHGNVSLLQGLIASNPSYLEVQDSDGYTPLHRAAYGGHVDTVRFLLSKGANPEWSTGDGWTVLHCASFWAMHEVVAVLLTYGVNVNCRSNGNLTPLHLAITSSQPLERIIVTVRYLVDAPGIDASVMSNAGETPLMLAKRTSTEIEEILARHFNKP